MQLTDTIKMQSMTDTQKAMYLSEVNAKRKNKGTAQLLCFFLGGLGAHRFYMGQTGLGILYACFVWTLIPAIVALVELFLIAERVRLYNEKVSEEAALLVKAATV